MIQTDQPLTGQDLYDFVSSTLLGFQIDSGLFYTLLSAAKSELENKRPWQILKSEDTTQIANTTDTYLSAKNLPSDFRKFYSPKRSIRILAADGITYQDYEQIPMNEKIPYKDDATKFYCDYGAGKLYLCGFPALTSTIHQYYIKRSAPITSTVAWVFPAEFHPILGYSVVAKYKLGIDYDLTNAQLGVENAKIAQILFQQMAGWDDELQNLTVEGMDYRNYNKRTPFIANSIQQ